jgi:tripartite-type tricarboxylate transporter receptor subunit TctC
MRYVVNVVCLTVSCYANATALSYAQSWPAKPVRWIVPFPPGGGVDITARTLTARLGPIIGQQIIVDNRGGANGNIGVELVTRSPADGHTVLTATTGNIVINPHVYTKLSFDPLKDLAPVTPVVDVINVLVVHPSLPARSVKELIVLARARPGQLNYGSSGPGGSDHVTAELFRSLTGAQITNVTYKGGAPAMVDLMAGNIEMMFATMAVAVGPIKAGRLRALSLTTRKRFEVMPDIPTIAEAGVPDYEAAFWFGVFVPAGTPREVVVRLNTEIRNVLTQSDVRQRLLESGLVASGATIEAFTAFVPAESRKWARLVQERGLRVE